MKKVASELRAKAPAQLLKVQKQLDQLNKEMVLVQSRKKQKSIDERVDAYCRVNIRKNRISRRRNESALGRLDVDMYAALELARFCVGIYLNFASAKAGNNLGTEPRKHVA